jgi:formate dehydrogenase assembly factor FdhD
MRARADRIYCQRCKAINKIDRDSCVSCGTPLFIINSSPAHRIEDHAMKEPRGEHLLERISTLETNLARVTDLTARILDLMMRQSAATEMTTATLTKLVTGLAQSEGVVLDLDNEKEVEPRSIAGRARRRTTSKKIEQGNQPLTAKAPARRRRKPGNSS